MPKSAKVLLVEKDKIVCDNVISSLKTGGHSVLYVLDFAYKIIDLIPALRKDQITITIISCDSLPGSLHGEVWETARILLENIAYMGLIDFSPGPCGYTANFVRKGQIDSFEVLCKAVAML